jgi:hypothetical protein
MIYSVEEAFRALDKLETIAEHNVPVVRGILRELHNQSYNDGYDDGYENGSYTASFDD